MSKDHYTQEDKEAFESQCGSYVREIDKLSKENKRLKSLLIRCKEYLPEWITPMDILAEIDKLKEVK